MPYLSASAVMIHYEEALCQVYAPLALTKPGWFITLRCGEAVVQCIVICNRSCLSVCGSVTMIKLSFSFGSGCCIFCTCGFRFGSFLLDFISFPSLVTTGESLV